MRGRGCRRGPGPAPTPVLSAVLSPTTIAGRTAVAGGMCAARSTAFWFEGRILRDDGEMGGTVPGGSCWDWDGRLDVSLEVRGEAAPGTELRSGAIL